MENWKKLESWRVMQLDKHWITNCRDALRRVSHGGASCRDALRRVSHSSGASYGALGSVDQCFLSLLTSYGG
jgi:hypothetical protein